MQTKHRILFIVPLPPPIHGSSMMCDYVRQSKLINSEFDCDFINLSTSRSIDEIGKGGIKKYYRFISSIFKTFWKLLTKRYEVCYIAMTCHGTGFLKDAPFALLCKLFGKKLVIHQHNKGMSRDLNCPWRVRLLKAVYKNSTVILLSWRLYPDIEAIVSREQIMICPNGIPEDPVFKKATKRDNPIIQLLFLSNLIPSKGVYVLLDALKILKDRGYSFICNYVGGESKEITAEVFEKAVRERGLNEVVVYLGKKYGDEKNKILAKNDVLIFPTFNETFGLVNLEAMQARMPVISTDESAIPDIVIHGQSGFICNKQDPVSLSDCIAILIDNPVLRNQMGETGYNYFKDKFTIDKFEQTIVKCLHDAMIR